MSAPQRPHPPSVEQLLNTDGMTTLQERYGRSLLRKAVRDYQAELGRLSSNALQPATLQDKSLLDEITARLEHLHTQCAAHV